MVILIVTRIEDARNEKPKTRKRIIFNKNRSGRIQVFPSEGGGGRRDAGDGQKDRHDEANSSFCAVLRTRLVRVPKHFNSKNMTDGNK